MAIDFELTEDGVATITLNRPERLNAMDAEHYRGLADSVAAGAGRSSGPRRDRDRRGRPLLHGWRRHQELS